MRGGTVDLYKACPGRGFLKAASARPTSMPSSTSRFRPGNRYRGTRAIEDVVAPSTGQWAVHEARAAIAGSLGLPAPPLGAPPPEAEEPRGVFVTLVEHPSRGLRGCIGYPLPVLSLAKAVRGAAVASAHEDPRFPPLLPEEFDRIVIEVSILTPPEPIAASDPEGRLASVEVGRDGLIVRARGANGLLLPQVAVEQGWNAAEFLDATCEKAGLPFAAWRRASTVVERFEAEVFAEVEPNGPVAARRGASSGRSAR